MNAQIAGLREGSFTDLVRQFVPVETVEEQWDLAGLERVLADEWQIDLPLREQVKNANAITDACATVAAMFERVRWCGYLWLLWQRSGRSPVQL